MLLKIKKFIVHLKKNRFHRALEVTLGRGSYPLRQSIRIGELYPTTPHDLKSILWSKSHSKSDPKTPKVDQEK